MVFLMDCEEFWGIVRCVLTLTAKPHLSMFTLRLHMKQPVSRRRFLQGGLFGLATLSPGLAAALGERDRFAIAMLRPERGHTLVRKEAPRRLMHEVEKRTSVEVTPGVSVIDFGPDMFSYPLLILSGEREFAPWTEAQVDQLRTYLKAGGLLVIDACSGVKDGPFAKSAARELARVFPAKKLEPVPGEHVLYKSFYLLKQGYGRTQVDPTLRGIFEADRLMVLMSHNDMLGAWARDGFGNWKYEVVPGGTYQRERAFRLGINIVMYALCVNYKADQVHIPFILKRRKWRVP